METNGFGLGRNRTSFGSCSVMKACLARMRARLVCREPNISIFSFPRPNDENEEEEAVAEGGLNIESSSLVLASSVLFSFIEEAENGVNDDPSVAAPSVVGFMRANR